MEATVATEPVSPAASGGTSATGEAQPQPQIAAVVLADEPLTGQAMASALRSSSMVEAAYQPSWQAACQALADPDGKALLWLSNSMTEDKLKRVSSLREARPGVGTCLIARSFELPGIHELAMRDATRLSILLRTERLVMADIVRALLRLKSRTVTLTPDVLSAITRTACSDDAPLARLTTDERSVLELAAMGLRNCEIARRLHRSEKLIEKRIGSIFSKLSLNGDAGPGVDRRVAAARIYLLHEQQANVVSA